MRSIYVTKHFFNKYSGQNDSIDIHYSIPDGFESLSHAKWYVKLLERNPELFLYVSVDDQYYPITMASYLKNIICSKEILVYRDLVPDETSEVGKMKIKDFRCLAEDRENVKNIEIGYPNVKTIWRDELANDIRSVYKVDVVCGKCVEKYCSYALCENAITLLGTASFDALVPVFKLNVMDLYMKNSPSELELWEQGVIAYNYYTGEKIEQAGKYTYSQFLSEQF